MTDAACHRCHGTGREPGLDPGVVPLIAAAIGGGEFTTHELQNHARLIGGPLQAALADFDGQRLGIALGALGGLLIDGYRLERIGTDRGRVALWRVCVPD